MPSLRMKLEPAQDKPAPARLQPALRPVARRFARGAKTAGWVEPAIDPAAPDAEIDLLELDLYDVRGPVDPLEGTASGAERKELRVRAERRLESLADPGPASLADIVPSLPEVDDSPDELATKERHLRHLGRLDQLIVSCLW